MCQQKNTLFFAKIYENSIQIIIGKHNSFPGSSIWILLTHPAPYSPSLCTVEPLRILLLPLFLNLNLKRGSLLKSSLTTWNVCLFF